MTGRLICLFAAVAIAAPLANAEKVEFPSQDDLTITADVYFKDKDDPGLPFICLFHQAGFSRGEYLEIAPRLVELGYNCMAADARSGRKVNGLQNETASRAKAAKKGQQYIHAYPDIVATLQYARDTYAEGPLIAWGSSYSASLVLKVSAENEGLVDGSLSFAPNSTAVWTRDWLIDSAGIIKHPVFLTSARREQIKWKRLMEAIPESQVTSFIPKTSGRHGSRALWKEQADHEAYWAAVEEFLAVNFPPTPTPKEVATTGDQSATPGAASVTRPTRPARPDRPRTPVATGAGHGAGHGGGHGDPERQASPAGHANPEEQAKPTGHGKPSGHEKPGGHGKPTGHEKPDDDGEPAGHGKPGQ